MLGGPPRSSCSVTQTLFTLLCRCFHAGFLSDALLRLLSSFIFQPSVSLHTRARAHAVPPSLLPLPPASSLLAPPASVIRRTGSTHITVLLGNLPALRPADGSQKGRPACQITEDD